MLDTYAYDEELYDESDEEWYDDSDVGCNDCTDNECTGHCMSCPYRPV